MTVTERIYQHVQKLPEPFQMEVLDFVEYLLAKVEGETPRRDERVWSSTSLILAVRDKDAAGAFKIDGGVGPTCYCGHWLS
jgi:hypothetical protein